jgi:hypothetical protein
VQSPSCGPSLSVLSPTTTRPPNPPEQTQQIPHESSQSRPSSDSWPWGYKIWALAPLVTISARKELALPGRSPVLRMKSAAPWGQDHRGSNTVCSLLSCCWGIVRRHLRFIGSVPMALLHSISSPSMTGLPTGIRRAAIHRGRPSLSISSPVRIPLLGSLSPPKCVEAFILGDLCSCAPVRYVAGEGAPRAGRRRHGQQGFGAGCSVIVGLGSSGLDLI